MLSFDGGEDGFLQADQKHQDLVESTNFSSGLGDFLSDNVSPNPSDADISSSNQG